MKLTIGMKCPDALTDAIEREAENQTGGPSDSEEHDIAFDELVQKTKTIAGKWFKHGEFIQVTIDTDEGTCVVEPA